MTDVFELHPNDLLYRTRLGEVLSLADHGRLASHLALCALCRFSARAAKDFDREIPVGDPIGDIQPLISVVVGNLRPVAIANLATQVPQAPSRWWRRGRRTLAGVATSLVCLVSCSPATVQTEPARSPSAPLVEVAATETPMPMTTTTTTATTEAAVPPRAVHFVPAVSSSSSPPVQRWVPTRVTVNMTFLEPSGARLVERNVDVAVGGTASVDVRRNDRTISVETSVGPGAKAGCLKIDLVLRDKTIDASGHFNKTVWQSGTEPCGDQAVTLGPKDEVRVIASIKAH